MEREIFEDIKVELGSAELYVGLGENYFGDTPKNTENPYGNYHYHVYDEVQIIIGGAVVIVTENERLGVKRGEMTVIPRGSSHFTEDSESGHERVCLNIKMKRNGETPDGYSYFRKLIDDSAYAVVKTPPELIRSILKISVLRNDLSLIGFCRYKAELYNIVCSLFGALCAEEENTGTGPVVPEKNSRLGDMVFDIRVSKREIAERLGYSLRHVERMIKKEYGCGLTELRNRSMTLAARRMMDDDPYVSLEKVVNTTGFSGYTVLYRSFVRYIGVSPQKYIKEIRKGRKTNVKP